CTMHRLWSRGLAWASEETPPRCGVTRAGVQRRKPTLVPRARQAPDGRQAGGSQPTESSRLTRRLFLAPALSMDAVHRLKKLQKIGRHLLTLEVISTLALSCCWKRERSGRCKQSAAVLG